MPGEELTPMDNAERKPERLGRRDFLRYAGLGLGLLASGGISTVLAGCAPPLPEGLQDHPAPAANRSTEPETVLSLRAEPDQIQILPGQMTKVWRYKAEGEQGADDAVRTIPNSYLGPILRFHQGERVRINFTNNLSEPSIVHWHGLHLPEAADGHPRLAIEPGETYTYDFTVRNRAGTYWYHPHPHGRTGPQVYYGLAGLLLISDDEETALGLPDGDYDVPLVIQDRTFTADNQLAYNVQGMRGQMTGFLGGQILVNGQPDFTLEMEQRPYRLRLLNGSNSRIYKLGWSDGRALSVIATDGGLLERPVERPFVILAPGERVELWADFTDDPEGNRITLKNLDFAGSGTFSIAEVHVIAGEKTPAQLPDHLSTITWNTAENAVNRRRPRTFALQFNRMRWSLNGRTFEMNDVAGNETVRLGDLEVWEFVNESSHMAMPHPIHIHNVQFQVIERQVLPQFSDLYRTVEEGYIDSGWKDTVLLMPGERAKVLIKFEDYEGLYLYHCHNLEHEDMGMMRNYRIKA